MSQSWVRMAVANIMPRVGLLLSVVYEARWQSVWLCHAPC